MHYAKKEYWEQLWDNTSLPKSIDPYSKKLNNYIERRFHDYYTQIFSTIDTKGNNFLEIGCANSVWLPYFAKEFNFTIHGIDYSEVGCQKSLDILTREGIDGSIECVNFFSPPKYMIEKFHVVWSNGVVEHFSDSIDCIKAIKKLLKPGGIIITIIPNLTGINGLLQILLNKPIYNIHNPLDIDEFRIAHEQNGLNVIQIRYFLSINFGVINLNNISHANITFKIKRYLCKILNLLSKLIWLVENKIIYLPETKLFSPYIICVAKKSDY